MSKDFIKITNFRAIPFEGKTKKELEEIDNKIRPFVEDKETLYCCIKCGGRLRSDLDNALLNNLGFLSNKKLSHLVLTKQESEVSYFFARKKTSDIIEYETKAKCASALIKIDNGKSSFSTTYFYKKIKDCIELFSNSDSGINFESSDTKYGLDILINNNINIKENGFLKELIDAFTCALDEKLIDNKSPIFKSDGSFNPKDGFYYQIIVKKVASKNNSKNSSDRISISLYELE